MNGRAPGLRKRGEIWYIRFYDAFGRQQEERVGPSYDRAVKARIMRLADIESGRFGLKRSKRVPTLREFVDGPWRNQEAIALKPSTRRGYETALRHHLLPHFGDYPLPAITRAAVKGFIAQMAHRQRWSYATKPEHVNPDRPMLSRKTILNTVALLDAILRTAAQDYDLLPANPLDGILRRKNFPTDAHRPREPRPQVLEPEDFKRAVAALDPRVVQITLTAALTGLRWGELVALRIDEDVDFRSNEIRVTRALYRRAPQTPKSAQSVRDVKMGSTVRRIMQATPWKTGLIFSLNGTKAIGDGSWVKRRWRQAQIDAKIKRPIRWHDLRHQFVSLLIAAGKSPKYIAEQAGHASAGFTLDRYGHLFETIGSTPVEWPEDLLWPSGCPHIETDSCPRLALVAGDMERHRTTEQTVEHPAGSGINGGV